MVGKPATLKQSEKLEGTLGDLQYCQVSTVIIIQSDMKWSGMIDMKLGQSADAMM